MTCTAGLPTASAPPPPRRDGGSSVVLCVCPTTLSLSCGETPRTGGLAARRLPPLTRSSAGSACKRRDAVRLARKEGLQARARRTARRQLQ